MQMRSGPSARRPISTPRCKLIGEAKSGRRRLCADARNDQHHGGQARAAVRRDRRGGERREPRRRSASSRASSAIYLHIGSLAIKVSPDKAANRSLPDRPARRDRRALRQDPYVRRRSRQRRELSRIAQLPARRARRGHRPAVGPARPDDLLRPALPRAVPRAGGSRRLFLAIPSAFTRQTGEAHWHVLNRARAIENGCFVLAAAQGGKHENGRETFGHSLVVDPWGRILAEGGTEPGVVLADDRSGRGRRRARRASPRCSMGAASRSSSRWRSRPICARCGAPT